MATMATLTSMMKHSRSISIKVGQVPKNWILLDNQSIVDVFCDPKLLRNIQQTNKAMNIKCNAGGTRTNWVGDFPGYGEVWYKKSGIANILSPLSKVGQRV